MKIRNYCKPHLHSFSAFSRFSIFRVLHLGVHGTEAPQKENLYKGFFHKSAKSQAAKENKSKQKGPRRV